jgi:hypothetical protein
VKWHDLPNQPFLPKESTRRERERERERERVWCPRPELIISRETFTVRPTIPWLSHIVPHAAVGFTILLSILEGDEWAAQQAGPKHCVPRLAVLGDADSCSCCWGRFHNVSSAVESGEFREKDPGFGLVCVFLNSLKWNNRYHVTRGQCMWDIARFLANANRFEYFYNSPIHYYQPLPVMFHSKGRFHPKLISSEGFLLTFPPSPLYWRGRWGSGTAIPPSALTTSRADRARVSLA